MLHSIMLGQPHFDLTPSLTHLVLEAVSRVSVADGGLLHGRREWRLRRPPVEAGAAVRR